MIIFRQVRMHVCCMAGFKSSKPCCMAGFFKSSKPFELAGTLAPFGNGTHLFESLDPPLQTNPMADHLREKMFISVNFMGRQYKDLTMKGSGSDPLGLVEPLIVLYSMVKQA